MMWLVPLEMIYRLIVYIRNRLYDLGILQQKRLNGVVISVGNISVGGTGKSPIVKDIASRISSAGARPVILTRGYKSGMRPHEWQILLNGAVVAGVSRNDVIADEAMMQSIALPNIYVIVGAQRFKAARMFLSIFKDISPTHWILDDGFQHRSLYRDHDLVVLDARMPWGDCLPAGRFRETKWSLKRATSVIISKANTTEQMTELRDNIRQLNPHCTIHAVRFVQDNIRLVSGSPTQKIKAYALVCSVAKPDDVLNDLRSQNVIVSKSFVNQDHERIDPRKISIQQNVFQAIVTTEKDWARDCFRLATLGVPIFVAPLRLEWLDDFWPEFIQIKPNKTDSYI